tara:strand:+ start:174 stop:506 length:333 start_codon:yes stop_codon:yes gene_type:complete
MVMKKIIVQANFSEFAYSDIYDVADGKDNNPLQECNTDLDYIENFINDESYKRHGISNTEPTWNETKTFYFVQAEGDYDYFEKHFVSLESAMVFAGWRGLSALKGDKHGN